MGKHWSIGRGRRIAAGMLVASAVIVSGGVVAASSAGESAATAISPCKYTGSLSKAGTVWKFTRCGGTMTVVRTGRMGYCKRSYPVGTPWNPRDFCGSPAA